MRPTSNVLVVSSDSQWLQTAVSGLRSAASRLDNPLGLTFTEASGFKSAMQAALSDGNLQLVLIDRELRRQEQEAEEAEEASAPAALSLAGRLSASRPELSLYVALSREDEQQKLVETLASSRSVDGYFDREETATADFGGWFRIMSAQLADKSAAPFHEALQRYLLLAKDPWHSPAHCGGDSLRLSPWVADFHDFLGDQLLRADLSASVPALDSLLRPTGVIAAAQDLAAKAFGADRTFFITNGTSTANKVILQTLLAPGDKLLLDRNCHKSMHHGVVLADARPVYLNSSLCRRYGIFGPVSKSSILEALAENPDAKALVLTTCTYDGLVYDLKPIVEAAHKAGVKVIADEAWYAFARFHPEFRPTALESGADYVTQSTHKTLTALSQASMLHVNDPDFDEHQFRETLSMHSASSPQYCLIASLDVSRRQAVMEGFRMLDRTLRLADDLRKKINSTGAFRVLQLADLLPEELQNDGVRLDRTKLTVDISGSGYSADELQRLLFEKFNIQGEKSTFSTLTLLLTCGTTKAKVSRLHDALLRLAKERRPPRQPPRLPQLPPFTRLRCLPRAAFYAEGQRLLLLDDDGRPNRDLVGRVACDQVVSYPPGIPVLVPGQIIGIEIVEYLARLLERQRHVEMHGLADCDGEMAVRVLTQSELQALPHSSLLHQ